MSAEDTINRVFREFRRYTGDGLPGEPVNAPLPVGDPKSGVHDPKKWELRQALLAAIQAATGRSFRGAWDDGVTYELGDFVESGGSIWMAQRENSGIVPTEGPDWQLFLPGVSVGDASISWQKLDPSVQAAIGVDVRRFGADPTGVADSTAAVAAAAAAANLTGARLFGRGRFRLVGPTNITLMEDADIDCLLVSEWTGQFHIVGRKEPMRFEAGDAVLTQLAASSDLRVGSSRWSGWDDTAAVRDSFVIIETEQDFYSYRGVVQKRKELNRVFKDGQVSSPLKYSLEAVPIAGIDVLPMEERRRDVSLVIDLGDTAAPKSWSIGNENPYVLVETNRLNIDVSFKGMFAGNITTSPQLVVFNRCCHVKARLDFQWPWASSTGFNYGFLMVDCYDMAIEATGQGDGWGTSGNRDCRRVLFENCDLNRIDFHTPFYESMKVHNCRIGSWGILVTALGDLDVQGCDFHINAARNINNTGILRTRGDTAGFADGRLTFKNNTIHVDSASVSPQLLQHQQDSSPLNPKPAGSPIDYRFFTDIIIDGVKFVSHVGSAQSLNIQPFYISTPVGGAAIGVARNVVIKNISDWATILCDLRNRSVVPTDAFGPFPVSIVIENVQTRSLAIVGNSDVARVLGSIRNVRPAFAASCEINITAYGEYLLENFACSRLRSFFGTAPTHPVKVIAKQGVIRTVSGQSVTDGLNNAQASFVLEDVKFYVSDMVEARPSLDALLVRPEYFLNDVRTEFQLTNDLNVNTGGVWTLVRSPRAGQEVVAVFGQGGSTSEVSFRVPPTGRVVDIVARNDAGPLLSGCSRSADLNIGVGGRARYLKLG